MGFDGIVLADDMDMQAIVANEKLEDTAVMAAKPGADQILVASEDG